MTLDYSAASGDDDNKYRRMFDLANVVLKECNDAASVVDLNTAIFLFQEALNRRPVPHPLHSDSLKDIAAALVTRFTVANDREDLDEAMSLFREAVSGMVSQPEVRVSPLRF
jgi:hypothetical protein